MQKQFRMLMTAVLVGVASMASSQTVIKGKLVDAENGEQLIGAPAIDPKVFFKAQAVMKKLPDMYRELGALRKELEELKKSK